MTTCHESSLVMIECASFINEFLRWQCVCYMRENLKSRNIKWGLDSKCNNFISYS